jgi:hypothetical protein
MYLLLTASCFLVSMYLIMVALCQHLRWYGCDWGVAGLGGSRAGCNDMDSLRPNDDCEGTRKSFSRFCKCVYSIT